MTEAHESLAGLFRPRSIAVIGGSADVNKIGGRPIDFLKRGGFGGAIYPINPRAAEVQGLPAYASVRAVGTPVDQAIIALPAEQVDAAVDDCIAAGVGTLVMFSAGFAELGAAGLAHQAALTARVRAAGMRLLGPNSLGLFNVRAGVFSTFSTALDTGWPKPGGIAMVSQSGAFASYYYSLAQARGLGFSHLVATGNEADVDVASCLHELALDDEVRVIMAYIEGCRSGPRLVAALCAAQARGKPVVMMKVGVSQAGAAAAASHTGSLVGADAVIDAVFREHNVYRARSLDELLDVTYAAQAGVLPTGRRLGVVTTSGGMGVMLADAAEADGLELPEVAADAQAQIRALIPFAEPRNPVDTTAQIVTDVGIFVRVLDIVLDSTKFDVLINFLATAGMSARHFDRLRAPLSALRRKHPALPILISMATLPEVRAELEAEGFLVFEDPMRAARAARALVQFGQGAGPPAPVVALPPAVPLPPGPLAEIDSARLLHAAGVPMAIGRLARTADEAVAIAAELAVPVVLKIVSPQIAHKSEVGGVLVGLEGAAAVRAGFARILESVAAQAPAATVDGILVAPQVRGGVETLLGIKNDPVFGPVVVAGVGGILVELIGDAALRLAPVTEAQAATMITQTRLGALLGGLRGAKAGDVAGLARAIAALSRFGAAHAADIESIDINPFVVGPDFVLGLDALIVRRGGAG